MPIQFQGLISIRKKCFFSECTFKIDRIKNMDSYCHIAPKKHFILKKCTKQICL